MDERRWKEADRDQDGTLSKDEYPAFYQPWEYSYMHGVAAQENLEDIDTDKDGRVSLEEYLGMVPYLFSKYTVHTCIQHFVRLAPILLP